MLFNSLEFIFLFLPVVFVGYFWLCHREWIRAANGWLVLASLFFYGWWNPIYLPLLLGSIGFNYGIGTWLRRLRQREHAPVRPKTALIIGVAGNIALLGYFKYADFFLGNLNRAVGADIDLLHLVLPLGISFFTFTQIAFLVDVYRRQAREYSLLNYSLFVSYFPHLIAGPILHHREMMPQFADTSNRRLRYDNIARGLALFSIGLFKKVGLADTLSQWANAGFSAPAFLTLNEAWSVVLTYSFQLYFDFSGYTDMALGIALMFNIRLPINFNSPYKARTIQDFWRRWHMTLARFLKDYVYIPLGGNRFGHSRTANNLTATFLIGGLWHGAGWTFVIWGALHGIAMVIHRDWQKLGRPLPHWLAWLITFSFVSVAWVFFRADNLYNAVEMLKGMIGLHGVSTPAAFHALKVLWHEGSGGSINYLEWLSLLVSTIPDDVRMLAISILIVVGMPNSMQWLARMKANWESAVVTAILLGFSISILSFGHVAQFIYFSF